VVSKLKNVVFEKPVTFWNSATHAKVYKGGVVGKVVVVGSVVGKVVVVFTVVPPVTVVVVGPFVVVVGIVVVVVVVGGQVWPQNPQGLWLTKQQPPCPSVDLVPLQVLLQSIAVVKQQVLVPSNEFNPRQQYPLTSIWLELQHVPLLSSLNGPLQLPPQSNSW